MFANIIGLDSDSQPVDGNVDSDQNAQNRRRSRDSKESLDLDFLDKITLDSKDGSGGRNSDHDVQKKGGIGKIMGMSVEMENPVGRQRSADLSRDTTTGLSKEKPPIQGAMKLVHRGAPVWTIIPVIGQGFCFLILIFVVAMIFRPTPGGGMVAMPASFGEAIDTSKDPCNGLYEYACGKWIDNQVIPPDESRVSQWSIMSDEVDVRLSKILNSLDAAIIAKHQKMHQENKDAEAAHALNWSEKVRAVYSSCRRNDVAEELPDAVTGSISFRTGSYYKIGLDVYFTFKVLINPSDQVQYFVLSSVGDTELFEKPDAESLLTEHVKKNIETSNPKWDADSDARRFVEIYKGICENTLSTFGFHQKSRAGVLWDKLFDWDDLGTELGIDWKEFWDAAGFPKYKDQNAKVAVESQKLVDHLKELFEENRGNALLSYERAYFFFRKGKFIKGFQKGQEELYRQINHKVDESDTENWKWCTEYMRRHMGWALSRLYIEELLEESPGFERIATDMVTDMREEIEPIHFPWMDEETIKIAKEKVAEMKMHVAFPPWLKEINKNFNTQMEQMYGNEDFGQNMLEIDNTLKSSWRKYEASTIGKTNTRDWTVLDTMPIHKFSNFYDQFRNMFFFPASQLQAVTTKTEMVPLNWGSFATFIGHSAFHAFDEAGASYGPFGNKVQHSRGDTSDSWWSKGTQTEFGQVKTCIEKQYTGLGASNETTRENIADTAGVQFAYQKFAKNFTSAENKDWTGIYAGKKYSATQAFFISFAQMNCVKLRDPEKDSQGEAHGLPLAHIRVDGAAMNVDSYAEAFKCKKGTPMNPENKCYIANG